MLKLIFINDVYLIKYAFIEIIFKFLIKTKNSGNIVIYQPFHCHRHMIAVSVSRDSRWHVIVVTVSCYPGCYDMWLWLLWLVIMVAVICDHGFYDMWPWLLGCRTEGHPQLRSDSIRIELQNFADGRSPITNLLYRRPSVRGGKVHSG